MGEINSRLSALTVRHNSLRDPFSGKLVINDAAMVGEAKRLRAEAAILLAGRARLETEELDALEMSAHEAAAKGTW